MKLRQITEMATLKGWHPTDKSMWLIYVNGKDLDYVKAKDQTEAIAVAKNEFSFISDDDIVTAKLGEDEESDHFTDLRQADIKSINSDNTRQQIEDWLNANNTPYEWIVYFDPAAGHRSQRIAPTPGAITFVKRGNEGMDILSPHMILHTIGHAVMYHDSTLIKQLSDFASMTFNASTPKSIMVRGMNGNQYVIAICKFLHMKAAISTLKGHSRWSFPDMNEVVNEMCGIYIKNGKVKFEPNKYYDLDVNLKLITSMGAHINEYFKTMLDGKVGKVIYD